MNVEAQRIAAAPIRKILHVRAPQQRAFDVFTARMGDWWPAEHSILKAPRKAVVVEPQVGGRWYEVAEDGSEDQWGKVLEWEAPDRILLAWQLTMNFTYDPDFLTEVEVSFHPDGDGTRVEFEHRHLDRYGAEALATLAPMMDEGWGQILERYTETASA